MSLKKPFLFFDLASQFYKMLESEVGKHTALELCFYQVDIFELIHHMILEKAENY